MKEEWLLRGAIVPIDAETTAALIDECKRLIDVVGSVALAQHEWVGLTDEEATHLWESTDNKDSWELIKRVEAKLKEKNNAK